MYYVFHYDKKSFFAHMGELGMTLNRKDFATNEYTMDEQEYPRSASKVAG